MAVKWLQSAHYPPAAPKRQTGLTRAELEADYQRLEQALRKMEQPDGETKARQSYRPRRFRAFIS